MSALTLSPAQSTDGHSGVWSFSTARLNWHVAELAARHGGCLLVDATRSATKRFPDALSKTLPIWAAVINAAVAQRRGLPAEGVSLPPWVAESERAAVDARLAGWVEALQGVGGDVAGLASVLAKPLRPLWLSQESPLWALPCPDPAQLPYTPLLCVSASQPLRGHGQRTAGQGLQEAEQQGFSYCPGAGDDQESWARGLTPNLFWRHREQLLRCAEGGGLEAAVDALVAAAQGAEQPGSGGARGLQLRPAPAPLRAGAMGLHDLAPRGTGLFAAAPAAPGAEALERGGVRWLGDSGLGVCSFAALAAGAAVWGRTEALLLLCEDAEAATAEAGSSLAPLPPGALLCVHVARAQADRMSLTLALPACLAFAWPVLARGGRVLVACADGCERAPAALTALLAACFQEQQQGPCEGDAPPLVRLLADPALGAKGEGVQKLQLRRWLAFLSAHHADARPTRGLLKQAFQYLRLRV